MKIKFSPPYIDYSVIDEVIDSLKSGWITTGPKVKALENEIKKLCSAQEVLCVNSWTSGAIMMLKWLGVTDGDEVIVPAYTYAATALAVIHAGAKPIMVDITDDFNISMESVRNAITNKTKAIIPVDIAGWPCDYEKLKNLVNEPGIKIQYNAKTEIQKAIGRILILNDAAHSIGAKYNGKNIGTESDITIFSLHAVKNITTAEGGAICLNLPKPFDNSKLYNELRMMSLNFQTKDAFTKTKAGGWKYDIIGLGMKINMPDINAAIGLAQIRQYSELLEMRKNIFQRYQNAFSKFDWAILPPQLSELKESSCHIYALRINNITEEQRDIMIQYIAEQGVAVNVHFIPMPMLSYFRELGYKIEDYPQSYKNYAAEISLPIYPQLTDDEVNYVIEKVVMAYTNLNI
jgi:dTDP-4-amino-4,6-dideoxygalactose transaminase